MEYLRFYNGSKETKQFRNKEPKKFNKEINTRKKNDTTKYPVMNRHLNNETNKRIIIHK